MSECANGELRDLLPELVNGRLDAETQRVVVAHVVGCEACAEELALLRALRPGLVRGPVVDAAKIAAAVHAQTAQQARRDAMQPRFAAPWGVAIAAAALLAVSAIGYAVVTPRSTPVQAPSPQVAVAPPHGTAPAASPATTVAAGDAVLDNLSDLSDDDVRTLTASLGGISAVPDADPAGGIDPLGASLDDNSVGGT
jgi:anti-sigma factor RsiW